MVKLLEVFFLKSKFLDLELKELPLGVVRLRSICSLTVCPLGSSLVISITWDFRLGVKRLGAVIISLINKHVKFCNGFLLELKSWLLIELLPQNFYLFLEILVFLSYLANNIMGSAEFILVYFKLLFNLLLKNFLMIYSSKLGFLAFLPLLEHKLSCAHHAVDQFDGFWDTVLRDQGESLEGRECFDDLVLNLQGFRPGLDEKCFLIGRQRRHGVHL